MSAAMLDVYHITEREGQKSIWTRIGVAFVNRDDSLNILLETLPIDGRLHVRKRLPKDENGAKSADRAPRS